MIQKSIDLGPVHPWLPGMMKLNVSLDGDRIISAKPEFGFAKREILSLIKQQPALLAQRYFSRIDPEAAFVTDRIYSELIEKSTGIEAPKRAVWIRDIAVEIAEALNVLKYLHQMASHFGLMMLSHLIRKHREELLDMAERLSGSRYGYFYVVPGGARFDITDGFLERVEVWSKNFLKDFDRLKSLFCWTHPFQNRLGNLGLVLDNGDFGFISEARIEHSKLGWNSSVGSRLAYALEESQHLAESILKLSHSIESGPFFQKIPETATQKKVQTRFETLRGLWDVTLELGSNLQIKSVEMVTPSDQIKAAIPLILEEEAFDDIAVILSSANLSVTEVDR